MVFKEGNGFRAVMPEEGNGLRVVLPLMRGLLVLFQIHYYVIV